MRLQLIKLIIEENGVLFFAEKSGKINLFFYLYDF
jgi:hypothetical protein